MEVKACEEKFLRTLKKVCIEQGPANKKMDEKSTVVIKGMAVLLYKKMEMLG